VEILFVKEQKRNFWREQRIGVAMCLLWLKRGPRGVLNVAFSQGLPETSGNERLAVSTDKWALGTYSLVVAACTIGMPPPTAHRYTTTCGKMGAPLARRAKQGLGFQRGHGFGVFLP
jgi:hypothetical protein